MPQPKSQSLRPAQHNLSRARSPKAEELAGWSEDDGDSGSLSGPSPPRFAPLISPPPATVSSKVRALRARCMPPRAESAATRTFTLRRGLQAERPGEAPEGSINLGDEGPRSLEEDEDEEGAWDGGDDVGENEKDAEETWDEGGGVEEEAPVSSSSQPSAATTSSAVDRAAQHLEKLLTCVRLVHRVVALVAVGYRLTVSAASELAVRYLLLHPCT